MLLQSSVYKNIDFARILNYFWKLSITKVLRYLGEHLHTNWVSKFFIKAFKYQKYTEFS